MSQISVADTPTSSAEEREAFRDLWAVYDRHFDEITAATLVAAEALADMDPVLREIMDRQTPEQVQAENSRSRHLTMLAMHEGKWEPFIENLRDQGGVYARMGLPFSIWFPIVTAAQSVIVRLLFDTFGDDPARLQRILSALNRFFFEITMARIGEEYLNTRESVIKKQQEAIKELSTPVLPLRPGLILLPIIGVLDTSRARQLTEQLLEGIRQHRAKVVVMDLTGVPVVDSAVANHLLLTIRAARLLGSHSVVTGISTDNAQILTRIGVDLSNLITTSDLQGGIEEADWLLQSTHAQHEATASNGAPPVPVG
jgi:rsbT co-antagonist protein RsbR